MPYQGVPCTLRNAKSGQYLGVRNFWLVSRGAPSGRGEEVPQLGPGARAASAIVASDWVSLR